MRELETADWLIGPKLFRPKVYLTCVSSRLCEFILHLSAFLFISLHFTAILCISLHFYAFLCISLHFSAFHCISLHFSVFLCISLHFYALLCISMHFSAFHCISLHFSMAPCGTTLSSTAQKAKKQQGVHLWEDLGLPATVRLGVKGVGWLRWSVAMSL